MPYVDGAGIIVVSMGMSQLLYTQEITSELYKKPRSYSPLKVPAAELVHGSAYYWEAGAPMSSDWMSRHGISSHPDARPGERRVSLVFRAIRPEHAREYKLKYPYCMVEPSRKRDVEGSTAAESAGQPDVWM